MIFFRAIDKQRIWCDGPNDVHNDGSIKAIAKKGQNEIKLTKKCSYKRQRIFIKPKVNYDAVTYTDVISWENQAIYEPPYTKEMNESQIREFITLPLNLSIVSHSVQTERMIREVHIGGNT